MLHFVWDYKEQPTEHYHVWPVSPVGATLSPGVTLALHDTEGNDTLVEALVQALEALARRKAAESPPGRSV